MGKKVVGARHILVDLQRKVIVLVRSKAYLKRMPVHLPKGRLSPYYPHTMNGA